MVRVLSSSALMMAFATVAGVFTAQDASAVKLYGVVYNIRAGPDWAPTETKCKSTDVIASELTKLKGITDIIRLYSLTDCDQAAVVVPLAVKAGLKVSLGLWVGPEASSFEADKARLEELIAQDGLINAKDIQSIYVGSEALYRGDVNATVAIANVKAVKKLCTDKDLDIPITLADTTEAILKNPATIDAVDFVSPNVFPFWDKIDADKGPAQLYGKLQNLAKIAKGKDIVIGETGWPTDGVEAKGSKASMANAATYFEGFYKLAQEHDLKYYYFAGFDEDWKIATSSPNHTVEAYFGIFDKDGNIKDAYTALKSNDVSSSSSSSQVGDVGSASASASGSVDAGDDLPTKSSTIAKGSSSGSSSSEGDVVAAPASSDGSVSGSAVTTTTAPTASTISFSADELVADFSSDLEESDDYVPGGVSGAVTGVDSSNASSSEDAAASATTATEKASKKRKDCDA